MNSRVQPESSSGTKMAGRDEQDFNRSGLVVDRNRACYTGQRATRIPSGLAGVIGVDCLSLDLSFNEITSIRAIKGFAHLRELMLDNNELKDLRTLPEILTLHTLSVNNNKISDVDAALERINRCCRQIGYVSLLGNPGCPDQLSTAGANDEDDYERYRIYAVYVLPESLRFLDSRRVTSRERSQARDRGRFFKTVRLNAGTTRTSAPAPDEFDEVDFHVNYTPLPDSLRNPHDHRGAYGRCRYRYSGKNSEGNRFISNKDL